MHYNEYPYPDPALYLKDGRRISDYRVTTVPTKATWDTWFPGKPYRPLRILVVGCGTCEAIMVAATNPDNQVIGIDSSRASIDIATDIGVKEDVRNLHLYHCELDSYAGGKSSPIAFDIVIASGVLHHIKQPGLFLYLLRSVIADDGMLAVMVYGKHVRAFIPDVCLMLTKLGLVADEEGVECAKAILEALPEHHPAKEFPASNSQIADTWLHSYFRQYSASELINTVEPAGFSFRFWLSQKAIESTVIDSLPGEFNYLKKRFNRLKEIERFDMCQVLNHNDLKLTALFAAR